MTHLRMILATSGSSASTGASPRLRSGIFQKDRTLGRCIPITNLDGFPPLPRASATMAAMTAPTKPTPMTTTISRPAARWEAASRLRRENSREYSLRPGRAKTSPEGLIERGVSLFFICGLL